MRSVCKIHCEMLLVMLILACIGVVHAVRVQDTEGVDSQWWEWVAQESLQDSHDDEPSPPDGPHHINEIATSDLGESQRDPTGEFFKIVNVDGTPPDPGMKDTFSPLAVCHSNPLTSDPSRDQAATCRMHYTNRLNGASRVCTAWFVRDDIMVTAGHCVAAEGGSQYIIDWSKPRYVCCEPQSDFSCGAGKVYDIVNVVTTKGWYESGIWHNDAATMKVRRRSGTTHRPARWSWASAYRPQMCDHQWWYWAGFPARDNRAHGCNRNWGGLKHYDVERAALLNCDDARQFRAQLHLNGGFCGGMSGGPVYNYQQGSVVGVLSWLLFACNDGNTELRFTPFSANNQNTAGAGAKLQMLIDALN